VYCAKASSRGHHEDHEDSKYLGFFFMLFMPFMVESDPAFAVS
jgi:hypothetical protein